MQFETSSSQQGNWGVGEAQSYFSRLGFNISMPMGESALPYDMVIEQNGKFYTVQIKTTRYRAPSGWFSVFLLKVYRKAGRKIKQKLTSEGLSYLFVASPDANYCIPMHEFGDSVPNVLEFGPNGKWAEFKVEEKTQKLKFFR